jgi:hypothetical protein
MRIPQLAAFLVLVCSPVAQSTQPPAVSYPVTYPLDYRGRYLTQRDADEVVRFVKTLPGVDHHVVLISVKSPTNVDVHTGPGFRTSRGNTLYLLKQHGAWAVVQKSKGSGF